MKITDVRTIPMRFPAQPSFKWRKGMPGSWPAMDGVWVVIDTDAGISGAAPTVRGAIATDLVERYHRTELIGQDPFDREHLWQRHWELDRVERFSVTTSGLIDTALWDIAGKATGLPIHALLGTYRHSIPAYASSVTFDTTEEFLRFADNALARGYPALKLHAWGDAKDDARLCLALRDHVGPDVDLMYDGSAAFDLQDAVYLGRALSEANYLWYEEPMREYSITSYGRLANLVDVPLLCAEVAEGAHYNSADFILHGGAAGVRTDTHLRGGFTGAMRVAHLADAFQLRAEVHGGGLESAHLCAAISNNTYYEALAYSVEVDSDPLVVDGAVSAPSLPGVGWSAIVDLDAVPADLADALR